MAKNKRDIPVSCVCVSVCGREREKDSFDYLMLYLEDDERG